MAHAYKIWQCTAQWSSSAHPERHARRPHVRNKMSLIFGPPCTCMHHSVRGNVFSCLKYLITKRRPTYIISTQLRLYSLHKAPIQTQCNIHTRDVRNIFFYFGLVFEKKLFSSVQKTWFGSDIIVIYYSCNSWVVNLQQILQRQWMTWLWCHSQQQRQVYNVIAF